LNFKSFEKAQQKSMPPPKVHHKTQWHTKIDDDDDKQKAPWQ